MNLASIRLGTGAEPVVFLHGLYGQGKNFSTIAHAISDVATSYLPDLPNHGQSPWTVEFTLANQAEETAQWISQNLHEPVTLVGHSLGGKLAMRIALSHPQLVSRLMVVDIAPAQTDRALSLAPLVAALRNLDLTSIRSRGEADHELGQEIDDDVVRGFLLQNLRRRGDLWHWQANLDLLGDNLHIISGWEPISGSWDGPVYWVAGADSGYIQPEHDEVMRGYFPKTQAITIKNSGHWVHAEAPQAFESVLRHLLTLPGRVPAE